MLYKNDPRPASKDIYIVDDGGLLHKAGQLHNRGQVFLAVRGIIHSAQAAAYTSITDHDVVKWARLAEVPTLGMEELAVFEAPIPSGTLTGIQFSEAQFIVTNMVDYAGFEPLIVTWTKKGDGAIRTGSPVNLEYPPNQTTQQYCVQVSTVDLTIRSPIVCITLVGIQPENINMDNMVISAMGACSVPNYTKEFISNNELKITGVTSSDGDLNYKLLSITKAVSPNAGVANASGMRWKPINTMVTAILGTVSTATIKIWLDNSTRQEIVTFDTTVGTIGEVDVASTTNNITVYSTGPRWPSGNNLYTAGEIIEEEPVTVILGNVIQSNIPTANMNSLVVYLYQENTNDPSQVRVANSSDTVIPIGSPVIGITSEELINAKYVVTKIFLDFGSCTGRNEHLTVITDITEDMPEDINDDNMLITIGNSCDGPNFVKDRAELNNVSIKGVTSSDGVVEYSIVSVTAATVGAGTVISEGGADVGRNWTPVTFSGSAVAYADVDIVFRLGLFESIHDKLITRTCRLDQIGSIDYYTTAATIAHHSLDESVNVVIEDTQTEVKIGPLFVTDIEASVLEQVVVHFYQEQASDASGVRSANRTDPTCVPGQQRRGIDANMIDHGTHIYTKFLVTFPDCPVRDQEFTGSNIITLKQPTDINISSMSFGHGGACPVATSDEFAVDADIDNWFEISGVTSSDGILTYSMQTLLSGGGGGLYGTGYKWQGFSVSGNPGDSFTVTILLGLVDSTFTKQVTANVTLAQVGSVSENASSGYIEVHGEDLDVPEVQATVPSFVRLTALSYTNIPPAAVSGAVYHLYQQQTFNTASVRKADITDTVIAFNYDANGLLLQDLDQGNRLVTHILVSFPACPARNAHLENIEEIMVKPPEDINIENMEFVVINPCDPDAFSANSTGNLLELRGVTSSDGVLTYDITIPEAVDIPTMTSAAGKVYWDGIEMGSPGTANVSVTIGLIGGTVTEDVTLTADVNASGSVTLGVVTVRTVAQPDNGSVHVDEWVNVAMADITSNDVSQDIIDSAVANITVAQQTTQGIGGYPTPNDPNFNLGGLETTVEKPQNASFGEFYVVGIKVRFPTCPGLNQSYSTARSIVSPPPTDINMTDGSIVCGRSCTATNKMSFGSPDNWIEVLGVTSSDGVLKYNVSDIDGISVANSGNAISGGWRFPNIVMPLNEEVDDVYTITVKITLEGGDDAVTFETLDLTIYNHEIGGINITATANNLEYRSEGETGNLVLERTWIEARQGPIVGIGSTLTQAMKDSCIVRYELLQNDIATNPYFSTSFDANSLTFQQNGGWIRVGWIDDIPEGDTCRFAVSYSWDNCPSRISGVAFEHRAITPNPVQADYVVHTDNYTVPSWTGSCALAKDQWFGFIPQGATVSNHNGAAPSGVGIRVRITGSTQPLTSVSCRLPDGSISTIPCEFVQDDTNPVKIKCVWSGSADNTITLTVNPFPLLASQISGVGNTTVEPILKATASGEVVSFTASRTDGGGDVMMGAPYSFNISNIVTNPPNLPVEFAAYQPFPDWDATAPDNFYYQKPTLSVHDDDWQSGENGDTLQFHVQPGGAKINTLSGIASGSDTTVPGGYLLPTEGLGAVADANVAGVEYRGQESYNYLIARTTACNGDLVGNQGDPIQAYTKHPIFRTIRNANSLDNGIYSHMAMRLTTIDWDNDADGEVSLTWDDLIYLGNNDYRWIQTLDCQHPWKTGQHARVNITTIPGTLWTQAKFTKYPYTMSPRYWPKIVNCIDHTPVTNLANTIVAAKSDVRSQISGLHPHQDFNCVFRKPASGYSIVRFLMFYNVYDNSTLRLVGNTAARRMKVTIST